MKYYKKVTLGFVDWVVSSEEPIEGAIEISKDEYDSLITDNIDDDTIDIIEEED